jgi:hypothetical protein
MVGYISKREGGNNLRKLIEKKTINEVEDVLGQALAALSLMMVEGLETFPLSQ